MFVCRVCSLLIVIVAAALGPVTSPDAAARNGPRVFSAATSGQWQVLGAAKGRPSFLRPTGVATDAQGNVYVANTGGNGIVKVSSTGQLLATWGAARTSPIQFNTPQGVALDAHGNIYVADTGNNRVVKLSPTGMPLARWGTKGTGPRQFEAPSATALDSQGNIYVADTSNYRVVKLSPAGAPLAKWDTNVDNSNPDHQVTETPYGIAVSTTGTVYVPVDEYDYYIDAYKGEDVGTRLQQWSTDGGFLGEQPFPSSNLVIDSHGDFQIHGFTSDPVLELVRGMVGRALGTIAVDRAGNVYMTNGDSGRVYKYSPKGATLARWGTSGADSGRFFMARGIATDTHGDIYVADTGNNRLQELSPRGLTIATWPVTSPTSVAVDSRGTIYVGAAAGLLRKPANADALTPWIAPRGGVGHSVMPEALAVDAHNNIYVTADFVPFVQKLSPAGALLTRFRLPGQAGGECSGCVAVDKRGNVYVTNGAVLTPIEKFSATGKLMASWGKVGAKPEQCGDTGGSFAIDHQGNIYVADASFNCIVKFSPQGNRLAVWGTAGSEPGQFHQPTGVAVDSQGDLYVLDAGNNRIQELPAGH